MSRYVKEMMMSQLRQDFGDTKSLLILDLKGLDAMSEYQFRRDLRKKSIHVRTLKNNLAAKVFEDLGIHGLDRFLTGPFSGANVCIYHFGASEPLRTLCNRGQTKKFEKEICWAPEIHP